MACASRDSAFHDFGFTHIFLDLISETARTMYAQAAAKDSMWSRLPRRPPRHFPEPVSRAALISSTPGLRIPKDPANTDALRRDRLQQLRRHDWVVYAKTPLAGPVVLNYLSRYTHRVAVSNERIVGIDANGVRLRVRAGDGGGKRTVFIDGPSFIGRFLQHVLPPGFKRIRHYGLLSAATKSKRLAQARKALAMPAPDAQACEDATAFLKRVTGIEVSCCAYCRLGHWRTVEALPPERGSRAPTSHACMQRATVTRSLRINHTEFPRRRQRAGGGARVRGLNHTKWARFRVQRRRSPGTSTICSVGRRASAKALTQRARRIDSA